MVFYETGDGQQWNRALEEDPRRHRVAHGLTHAIQDNNDDEESNDRWGFSEPLLGKAVSQIAIGSDKATLGDPLVEITEVLRAETLRDWRWNVVDVALDDQLQEGKGTSSFSHNHNPFRQYIEQVKDAKMSISGGTDDKRGSVIREGEGDREGEGLGEGGRDREGEGEITKPVARFYSRFSYNSLNKSIQTTRFWPKNGLYKPNQMD